MTTVDGELLVRKLFTLTAVGDVEGTLGCFAHDARYFVESWHEPKVGHDEIRAELLRQRTVFTDFRTRIVSVAAVGGTVFVERIDTVDIGGSDVDLHTAGVFEISDGLIVRWSDYLDTAEIQAHLT